MGRHRPYTIKIELVRGCSMRCPFCALPQMPWADDPFEYMSMETFQLVTDQIAETWPKLRVEFAERGEMTFNPKFMDMMQYMREKIPAVQMTLTTNGDMVKRFEKYPDADERFIDWVYDALESGLNIAMIDCYTEERYQRFQRLFPEARLFYEEDVHPYGYKGPNIKWILLVDGTIGENHRIRTWHNAAGSVDAERAKAAGYDITTITEPLEKMCVRPFREIEIHYDGTVPMCCNDWKRENIIGNVHGYHLETLWDMMDVVREPLLRKARAEISPCNVCSERSGQTVGLEYSWFKDED